MGKGRVEAFSDGVIAIIITIMVLELKVPHGAEWENLRELTPIFLSYVLSFTYVGIYWNNHHHLFQVVSHVKGGILWANLHLLFWLSLFPFTTGWMGENHFPTLPVAVFGANLFLAAIAYTILVFAIIAHHGKDSTVARAIGSDKKGKISLVVYLFGIVLAFYAPWISMALYTAVALIWLVPDRRIEKVIQS
jgi:uncharacterized membrane protein